MFPSPYIHPPNIWQAFQNDPCCRCLSKTLHSDWLCSMFHVYVFFYVSKRRQGTTKKKEKQKFSVQKNLTNDDVKKSQQLIIEVQCERTCKKFLFWKHRKKT